MGTLPEKATPPFSFFIFCTLAFFSFFFFHFFFAALLKLGQLIRKVLPPLNVDPLVEGIHYQEKQTV